ncbi:TPA: hypothetical protein PNM72_001727 [Listeria monocytogenes]|uniref:Uncharacterized protein n=3 Tax=Listeria monocytogenes TaxID=1639 RepID=A0A6W7PHK0_LISMN|nr:hypothetical protein [Listeria monocytogenes]EAE3750925.1 hypothetical protein [Listeria monocytogenes serotype 1/2a]EAG6255447.1 hypothetical protein [Listeria monocytogenes CFSAN003807]ADB68975.1 hypothetical protein LM5578_2228 [Listeria monocytogenes 08-5578]ADB72020.1 hypothetical protein LM5923_2179 [Listeria monocytogenes 08-5923]AHF32890.1 hypothetical protein A430_2240 [Listeria monocytogenes serotype 1/2a str. 08-6569]
MLTKEATPELIKEWQNIYYNHIDNLVPNRKTGCEIDEYFRGNYSFVSVNDKNAQETVIQNIINNESFKEKLSAGVKPKPMTYTIRDSNIFVGIDLISGYFYVEGSEEVYDDLFAYRGLDESDLKNFYLVAEYIRCKK